MATLLIERAARVAQEQGWDGIETLSPDDWERLLVLVADGAQADGEALPEDWREQLGAFRDAARLRADCDDTRLAERGEVFSREDDA